MLGICWPLHTQNLDIKSLFFIRWCSHARCNCQGVSFEAYLADLWVWEPIFCKNGTLHPHRHDTCALPPLEGAPRPCVSLAGPTPDRRVTWRQDCNTQTLCQCSARLPASIWPCCHYSSENPRSASHWVWLSLWARSYRKCEQPMVEMSLFFFWSALFTVMNTYS